MSFDYGLKFFVLFVICLSFPLFRALILEKSRFPPAFVYGDFFFVHRLSFPFLDVVLFFGCTTNFDSKIPVDKKKKIILIFPKLHIPKENNFFL